MTSTQSQNEKVFKHVLETILPNKFPNLSLALDQAYITSVHELLTLSDKDIEDLYYQPPIKSEDLKQAVGSSSPTKATQELIESTALKKLEIAFRNQIRCFQGFYHMRHVKDNLATVSNDAILSWTGDEFDEFRVSASLDALMIHVPTAVPSPSSPSA